MEDQSRKRFCDGFHDAVEREMRAELEEKANFIENYSPRKLASLGLAVVNLLVNNVRNGLGGKTLLDLKTDPALTTEGSGLDTGDIKVGDIVVLDRMNNGKESGVGKNKTERKKEDEMRQGYKQKDCLEAVVVRISRDTITVSVEEDTRDENVLKFYNNTQSDARVWIVQMVNTVSYKRMLSTMLKLAESSGQHDNSIILYLLGETSLSTAKGKTPLADLDYFNPLLNPSQKEAINFALTESPFTLIHGPPGTGKTYTLIEIIKQLCFKHNERVLVCGPSNTSVDTILERLSPSFSDVEEPREPAAPAKTSRKPLRRKTTLKSEADKLIRIGHPARLLEANLNHSLDVLSKGGGANNEYGAILKDIDNDINETLKKVKKCKNYSERRALWTELKAFRKELREREKKVVRDLILGSRVVLATLHGCGSYELKSLYKTDPSLAAGNETLFDTIIIDEVSQALEPQCWIPMIVNPRFKRLIIAGDNMQLPPVVNLTPGRLLLPGASGLSGLSGKPDKPDKPDKPPQPEKPGKTVNLRQTLFDRIVKFHHGNNYKKTLTIQYRMHEQIMQFPSHELYHNQLIAHDTVRHRLLLDIDGVKSTDETTAPCLWYDTQGGDFIEQNDDNRALTSTTPSTTTTSKSKSYSKLNPREASLVVQHLIKLTEAGVPPASLGVISPYSAQVNLLKKLVGQQFGCETAIEVSTIDGFQGREKDAIVVSLVRSNDGHNVGFLEEKRRLNVAMTRPRRHLCVVGDMETLARGGNEYLQRWSAHLESQYEVIYPEVDDSLAL